MTTRDLIDNANPDDPAALRVILARMDERLEHIEDALRRDYHALHGNGSAGIIERLTRLEEARRSVWGTIHTILTLALSAGAILVAIWAAFKGAR